MRAVLFSALLAVLLLTVSPALAAPVPDRRCDYPAQATPGGASVCEHSSGVQGMEPMLAVNKRGGEFNDEDIKTLLTLASHAAVAIENSRLFQQSDFMAEMVHELRQPLAALIPCITL